MSRPLATIGIDIDPIDLHLAGQGHRSLPPDPLVYDFAVPRLLELCERCGIATTLFVVARDATAHSDVLTAAVDAGHEIASHSLTHPIGLASMPIEALRRECSESRWLLEQTSGAPVVGFRSPQFDMSSRALEVLAEAGYAYDASACPTPMLISTRLSMMVKNPDASGATRLKILPFTWRRAPHLRRLGTRTVVGWIWRRLQDAAHPHAGTMGDRTRRLRRVPSTRGQRRPAGSGEAGQIGSTRLNSSHG